METLNQSDYAPICNYVCDTEQKVRISDQASPELKLAMKVFREKSDCLNKSMNSPNDAQSVVFAVEQAADSALKVSESSRFQGPLASEIVIAHDRVRDFKEKMIFNNYED